MRMRKIACVDHAMVVRTKLSNYRVKVERPNSIGYCYSASVRVVKTNSFGGQAEAGKDHSHELYSAFEGVPPRESRSQGSAEYSQSGRL